MPGEHLRHGVELSGERGRNHPSNPQRVPDFPDEDVQGGDAQKGQQSDLEYLATGTPMGGEHAEMKRVDPGITLLVERENELVLASLAESGQFPFDVGGFVAKTVLSDNCTAAAAPELGPGFRETNHVVFPGRVRIPAGTKPVPSDGPPWSTRSGPAPVHGTSRRRWNRPSTPLT